MIISNDILTLIGVAIVIGSTHTLAGPDHYLPFIMLSRAKRWSIKKTLIITFICGVAHVLSSVVLGLIGYGIGTQLQRLEIIEAFRGDIAAWLLFSFGIVYFAWGIKQAVRGGKHTHKHFHLKGGDLEQHEHEHIHSNNHAHVHKEKKSTVFWGLFIIFAFGPCEPLIPLLIYPAAEHNFVGATLVAVTFSLVTITTMLFAVTIGSLGLNKINSDFFEKYAHALAGFAITVSSSCILFLGL